MLDGICDIGDRLIPPITNITDSV